jgi:azurin
VSDSPRLQVSAHEPASRSRLRPPRRAMFAVPFLALIASPGCGPPRASLYVESDGDFLAFKPDELTCPSGARVTLTFHHAGERVDQMHDWVLLKPGAADAFMDAVMQAGEAHGWMPPNDPRVLAATPTIDRGQSVTITFTAPAPGDYPFVCTYAGHGYDMRGVLHVLA